MLTYIVCTTTFSIFINTSHIILKKLQKDSAGITFLSFLVVKNNFCYEKKLKISFYSTLVVSIYI